MTRLSYLLRKHPMVRFATLALFVVAGVSVFILCSRVLIKKPVIDRISPDVGTPGDMLIIRGSDFGNQRASGYVELCGNRITESSYISWKDDEIKIIIPGNTDDGLVYVVTRGGKSNPDFFANELAIPVSMPENPTTRIPVITEISPEEPYVGQVLVITGKNFGSNRENSAVYFSSRREGFSQESIPDQNSIGAENKSLPSLASEHPGFILPSELDFDYEYWSETEIRVRVPDSAETGSVFVITDNYRSAMQPVTIKRRAGEKTFPTSHTYLIQVESNLENIKGKNGAVVTLHAPHPAAYSLQPTINMTESIPEAALLDYRNTSVFQISLDENSAVKAGTVQNFVVQCCSTETNVYRDSVRLFNEKNRMLYRTYTKADDVVPADTEVLEKLLPNIIFKVTNPYRRAEMIFDYMVENYKLSGTLRPSNADPLELVEKKQGDAYDFAAIYTALLRTCGIPARFISGILVNADKRTQNHWWSEFYIEDFGWIPVDVALGAGMQFDAFQNERHPPRYYFGNLDAQHVAFSLTYNTIKPSVLNTKIVYIPRSYALQSVWEETSDDIESYSSYWATPAVLGIY